MCLVGVQRAKNSTDHSRSNKMTVFSYISLPLLFFMPMIHFVFFPLTYHLLIFYSNLLSLLTRSPPSSFFFFISAAVPVITPSFWLLSSLPQYPFYCLCLLPSSPFPPSPPPSLSPLHPTLLPVFPPFFLPRPHPRPSATSLISSFVCSFLSPSTSTFLLLYQTLVSIAIHSSSSFPFSPNISTCRSAAGLLEQGGCGPVAAMGREGVRPAADHQRLFPDEWQGPAAAH